ncbi:MAG: hypothetical protein ACQERB_08850 [Promethearchaeati archaeon]
MANGKELAVAGLILGLIGAGLGGYVFFDNILAPELDNGDTTSEIKTYYVEDHGSAISVEWTITPLSGMNITFTTNQTMKLHALFTCYLIYDTSEADITKIYLYLNEFSMTPSPYFIDDFDYASSERYYVSMQAYNNSLPPGTYSITVRGKVDDISTVFAIPSLFAEVYN